MASKTTNTIQNSINWSKAFVVQRPMTGVAAIAGEPATTSANLIIQSILGAPFKWEWNRISLLNAITTQAGKTDYAVVMNDFGYLEKAVLYDGSAQPPAQAYWELETYKIIGTDGKQNRPLRIATLLDDNNGSITFRLFPAPDKIYKITLDYQKAPIFIAQGADLTTTTWAPIPDKMSYLYQRGFLAQLQGMYNSQLYLAGMEMFFRQLVAAAEGLTEAEKAIFLEDSLRGLRTKAAELLTIQQGKGARS
jgi:hypothetical protein